MKDTNDPFTQPSAGQVAPPPPAYAQQPPQPQAYGTPAAPGQMQGYTPAPQYRQSFPNTWMNITSLVMGILGIVGLLPFIGSVAAIILGHMGKSAVKNGTADQGGLGTAGLILGYAGIVLGLLGVIFFFVFFGALIAAGESGGFDVNDF